jgi:hypothetical protein
MTYLDALPKDIAHLIRTRFVAEFGTVTSAGMPIDSPIIVFISEDQTTLDLGTGLAYPAKAERARKNPKVGLLLEGPPNEPVISVAGLATVRDTNLQANMNRYISENILAPFVSPKVVDYNLTRQAVWYFTRILVLTTPTHIRWWNNPAEMDKQPQEWRAPAGTAAPKSDPVPPGAPSEAPKWPQPSWQDLAKQALGRNGFGHLTMLDANGHPLSIRARECKAHNDGFLVTVPKGAPWSKGQASLSFEGLENFLGEISLENGQGVLRVARALPILPLMADVNEVLSPKPDTKAALMKRLEHEAKRRGQPIPTMPATPPESTAGGRLRAQAAEAYTNVAMQNA